MSMSRVTDGFRSSLGFKSRQILRLGAITIQGSESGRKELMDAVIEIIGECFAGGSYKYRMLRFIGMTRDTDTLKIDILPDV